jgi:glutaminyl-peptide cyclotransferase
MPYFCPMRFSGCLIAFALVFSFIGCTGSDSNDPDPISSAKPVPAISYSVVAVHPHDTSYFTEGLEFYNGFLVESTGLQGKSLLVQMEFPSAKVVKQVKLDPKQFGEGITILKDTVYQLTYQEHVVNVYDAKSFRKVKEIPLNGEGWGLTNDGKQLIASDGSSNLYFYEPGTFRLLRVQSVNENDVPAVNINELEYVNGYIYANQWQYDYILKIDPNNGQVVAKMDLGDVVRKVRSEEPKSEFLNGIAYNPATKKFYVTGKNWPAIYELQFSF